MFVMMHKKVIMELKVFAITIETTVKVGAAK